MTTKRSVGRPRKHDPNAETRVCSTCNLTKNSSDFPPNYIYGGRVTVATRCKECKRESHVASSFGISMQEFRSMVTDQRNSCAICFKHLATTKEMHIDHCHSTGRVRGILCGSCNRGIGLLQDDPDIILSAYNYLNSR